MLSVRETDRAVSVCATLAITPLTASTSRRLTITLASNDGTGNVQEFIGYYKEKLHVTGAYVATAGSDYTAVSMDVVFPPGSTNGFMQCISVSVLDDDDALPAPETFTVTLTTASTVILRQIITSIAITDSIGNGLL